MKQMTRKEMLNELELIGAIAKSLETRSYTIREHLLRFNGAAPSGGRKQKPKKHTEKELELITDLRRRLIKKPAATGSIK